MPIHNLYIYSFADLNISPFSPPGPGTPSVTGPGAAPDILTVFDNVGDAAFDGVAVDPITGAPILGSASAPLFDTSQLLATNLVVDGVTVGMAGQFVTLEENGASIKITATGEIITGHLVIVFGGGGPEGPVGFVTSAPIGPSVAYTYQGPPLITPPAPTYSSLANCFTRDTMIECENGPVAVQDIVAGDLVVTRNNGLQTVRWAGCRKVAGRGEMAPVRVKAGALGNAVDLRFSPMHRVLISGARAEVLFGKGEVLAHAAHLCDGDRIYRAPCEEVEYFHILFDHHEIIRAHGCWSESFAPSSAALEAVDEPTRAEVLKLFPELDQDWQDALPTLSALEAAMLRC